MWCGREEKAGPGSRKPGEEGISEKGQALSFESQLDVIKTLGNSKASLMEAWWESRPHHLRGTHSASASTDAGNFMK